MKLNEKDISRINELLKQLSPNAKLIGRKDIRRILKTGYILAIRNTEKDNEIIGMGTLVFFEILNGFVSRVEDVVVDEKYRGKGFGKRIVEGLITKAKEIGCKHIDLTSSPHRVEANGLYQKLGFEKRETNIYRLKL